MYTSIVRGKYEIGGSKRPHCQQNHEIVVSIFPPNRKFLYRTLVGNAEVSNHLFCIFLQIPNTQCMKYKVRILIQTNMGTNTDTKLIEISPYMDQIRHSLNSREITRNVQEGSNTKTFIQKRLSSMIGQLDS